MRSILLLTSAIVSSVVAIDPQRQADIDYCRRQGSLEITGFERINCIIHPQKALEVFSIGCPDIPLGKYNFTVICEAGLSGKAYWKVDGSDPKAEWALVCQTSPSVMKHPQCNA